MKKYTSLLFFLLTLLFVLSCSADEPGSSISRPTLIGSFKLGGIIAATGSYNGGVGGTISTAQSDKMYLYNNNTATIDAYVDEIASGGGIYPVAGTDGDERGSFASALYYFCLNTREVEEVNIDFGNASIKSTGSTKPDTIMAPNTFHTFLIDDLTTADTGVSIPAITLTVVVKPISGVTTDDLNRVFGGSGVDTESIITPTDDVAAIESFNLKFQNNKFSDFTSGAQVSVVESADRESGEAAFLKAVKNMILKEFAAGGISTDNIFIGVTGLFNSSAKATAYVWLGGITGFDEFSDRLFSIGFSGVNLPMQ